MPPGFRGWFALGTQPAGSEEVQGATWMPFIPIPSESPERSQRTAGFHPQAEE